MIFLILSLSKIIFFLLIKQKITKIFIFQKLYFINLKMFYSLKIVNIIFIRSFKNSRYLNLLNIYFLNILAIIY